MNQLQLKQKIGQEEITCEVAKCNEDNEIAQELERNQVFQDLRSQLEHYPETLQVKHIADFLGISRGTAYKILESGGIPRLQLPESKLIRVPKSRFIEWLLANTG